MELSATTLRRRSMRRKRKKGPVVKGAIQGRHVRFRERLFRGAMRLFGLHSTKGWKVID